MIGAVELMTVKFARPLLVAAGLPAPPTSPAKSVVLLDNACGSGVVTATLLEMLDEQGRTASKEGLKVTCADLQEPMINYVKERMEKEKWEGVEAKLVDAQDTKLPSSTYTHILTAFGIMLLANPSAALKEIHRLLLPGGVNAFTTWHTVGWISLVRNAFEAIPGCPPFQSPEEYSDIQGTGRWDQEAFVRGQLEAHGFEDVSPVEVRTEKARLDSPEMFVGLFGNMTVGFSMRKFSEDQKAEFAGKIKETLLKQLQEKHGEGKPFDLEGVANVFVCRKPEA